MIEPWLVYIGDNCYVGSRTRLFAYEKPIVIGNNVLIAPEVLMITRQHNYAQLGVSIAAQGYSYAPISIEDEVWIGFRAIILSGVTIGHHSIVAANAVVTKDVEPYSVVGGIPAEVISKRVA